MNKEQLCLHCGERLLEMVKGLSWNYICSHCGRIWGIDKNGNWYIFFVSDLKRIYTAEEVKEAQKVWRARGN